MKKKQDAFWIGEFYPVTPEGQREMARDARERERNQLEPEKLKVEREKVAILESIAESLKSDSHSKDKMKQKILNAIAEEASDSDKVTRAAVASRLGIDDRTLYVWNKALGWNWRAAKEAADRARRNRIPKTP